MNALRTRQRLSWSRGWAPARILRRYSTAIGAGFRFDQTRQCGDDVLRMLVTGGPPVRGGSGMPQRISVISVPVAVLRITGAG
jgi:hypothetical protein